LLTKPIFTTRKAVDSVEHTYWKWQLRSGLFSALLLLTATSAVFARRLNIKVVKQSSALPKVCESVAQASLTPPLQMDALIREVVCRGAGDMISDYTYVLNASTRKVEKGRSKETSTTYEVYFPVLKNGTAGQAVLLVTGKNGARLSDREIVKERQKAGDALEKEEKKIGEQAESASETKPDPTAVRPVGMYPFTSVGPDSGVWGVGASVDVATFLNSCDLQMIGPVERDGRSSLLFAFKPRAGAKFDPDQQYIAQLDGRIWIDVADHVVACILAWPSSPATRDPSASLEKLNKQPPAISVEMMRLPEGVWLPKFVRINSIDHRGLFQSISSDSTLECGEYKRFLTEARDVKITTPKAR
jgi:hypothetical protein